MVKFRIKEIETPAADAFMKELFGNSQYVIVVSKIRNELNSEFYQSMTLSNSIYELCSEQIPDIVNERYAAFWTNP